MHIQNKYTQWYYNIVNNAIARGFSSKYEAKLVMGYVEQHHIIPRSLGGTNDSNNLVCLTAKEHFVCHLLLPKMYTDKIAIKKMQYALNKMLQISSNQSRIKIASHFYEKIRNDFAKNISSANTGRIMSPLTAEHKAKLSKATKGVPKPESTIKRMKIAAAERAKQWEITGHPSKGIKLSEDAKRNQSSGSSANRKILLTCPHCGKLSDKQNYGRWHGIRCKNYLFNDTE